MAVRSPDGWTQQVAARTVSSVGRRRRPAIARGRIDSRRRHRCQNSLPACSYRPHWGAQRWHRRRRRMRRQTSKIQRPRAPQVLIVHPAKLALLPAQERRARLLKPREARRGPAATKIRNTRARQAPSAEGPGRPDGLYGERRIATLEPRFNSRPTELPEPEDLPDVEAGCAIANSVIVDGLNRDPERAREVIAQVPRSFVESGRYSAEEVRAAVDELLGELEAHGQPRTNRRGVAVSGT